MTARLPIPGADDGTWGDVLNDYLSVELAANGTLKIRSDGTLAPVATSGVYTDLTGKPSLSTVAITGSYTDLINQPTLTTSDATSSSKGVVQLAGDLGGTAASPTVPGLTSKYTLPSGGIPESDLASAVQTKLNSTGSGLDDSGVAALVTNGSSQTATALDSAYAVLSDGYNLATLTPENFGAAGDGTTDDTAALAAWAASGKSTLSLRPGSTYCTSATIVHPITLLTVIGNGATIKATASMTSIWAHTATTNISNLRVTAINFNCANLAGGPSFGSVSRGVLRDIKVINSAADGFTVGAAPPQASSNGMLLDHILVDYTSAQPSGSRGIVLINADDGLAIKCEVIGAEIGFLVDSNSGAWRWLYAHSWGRTGTLPITCFDDSGHDTQWIFCYGDTAISYGWRKQVAQPTQIIGGNYYHNSAFGNDNVVVAIQLDAAATQLTVSGLIVEGASSTHRVASDVVGDLSNASVHGLTTVNVVKVRGANLVDPGPDDRTTGQESFSRSSAMVTTSTTSGALQLAFFTATRSETVSQVRIGNGVTPASGVTLARVGLYQIGSDGSTGTLIASIPNDTNLFNAANTSYTDNLSAPVTLSRGQRYALGVLIIASTMPSIVVNTSLNSSLTAAIVSPRLAGRLSGQADLPASFTGASLGTTQALRPYIELLP